MKHEIFTCGQLVAASIRRGLLPLAIGPISLAAAAQTGDVAARFGPAIDRLNAEGYASLEAIYKDIHSHPELRARRGHHGEKACDGDA